MRSALEDEALAAGLKSRIGEMQGRLERLEDRSSKRRQIARDVMTEIDVKKIVAPDFTVSVRPVLRPCGGRREGHSGGVFRAQGASVKPAGSPG